MKAAKKSKAVIILAIGLVVMILGSILASAFHSSFFSVDISRIYFETEKGTLSGLLYMPKGASASDPRPTLVTTHGYLNSAEMQDAPATEMARRGCVVLALDMYDHGHSTLTNDEAAGVTSGWGTFWPTSIWDAVQYMYGQDYVLKDSEGNGIIAVSGHSMGGFSSTMALYYDEMAYQTSGIRMICAGLSVGSDYSYTALFGVNAPLGASMFGGRTIGKIAAQFDEFFFNAPNDVGTVNHKNYVQTVDGQIILETISYDEEGNAVLDPNTQPNTWYQTSDGGQRIIYQPYETHPWNHFSKKTTADMISFYDVAFADYNSSLTSIEPGNQIWMFKEAFELVAMVGFFMFLISLAVLLVKVPFLKNAVTGSPVTTAPAATTRSKVGTASLFIITMLIPAIIYPAVYSNITEAKNWLTYGAILAVICGIIGLIVSLKSKDEANKKGWTIGSVVVIIAGILGHYMVTKGLPNNEIFQGPTVSSIATWAVICACIATVVMAAVYLLGNKKEQGSSLAAYGVTGKPINVVAALCVAIIVAVVAFICVFLMDAILKVDFRIWVFAFKSFEATAIPAALKYMPFFLIYYIVAGIACVSNTSSEKLQGAWGYILAMLTNMGGIALWMILQYGMLFATGSAFYPSEALSGILLVALIPTLAIASWLTKFLYKKTGNIWTAAFLNTILMTMMTVANTTIYYQA